MNELREQIIRLAALLATVVLLLVGATVVTGSTILDLAERYVLPLEACLRLGAAGELSSCKDLLNAYFVLMLSALAFAIPFKVKFFNVGVEGQSLGGSTLLFLALYFFGEFAAAAGSVVGTLAALAVAAAGGALVGLIPYALWRFFGINGVVSTLITNLFLAAAVAGGLSIGGLMDTNNQGVQSISLPAEILRKLGYTTFYGLIEAPAFFVLFFSTVITLFLFWRTRIGLFSDAVGNNPRASKVIGLDVAQVTASTVFIGLAFGGVVGLLYTLENGRVSLDYFRNIGFEGIGVAVFGGCRPFGMIVSGFFIALWRLFGNELQMLGLPAEFTLVGFGLFIISAILLESAGSRWIR
jgi:general nucleoside transport system permease protein